MRLVLPLCLTVITIIDVFISWAPHTTPCNVTIPRNIRQECTLDVPVLLFAVCNPLLSTNRQMETNKTLQQEVLYMYTLQRGTLHIQWYMYNDVYSTSCWSVCTCTQKRLYMCTSKQMVGVCKYTVNHPEGFIWCTEINKSMAINFIHIYEGSALVTTIHVALSPGPSHQMGWVWGWGYTACGITIMYSGYKVSICSWSAGVKHGCPPILPDFSCLLDGCLHYNNSVYLINNSVGEPATAMYLELHGHLPKPCTWCIIL